MLYVDAEYRRVRIERFRGRCSRPVGRRDQCRGQAGSRRRVPQPGILRTSRWFSADGTARGMDGR